MPAPKYIRDKKGRFIKGATPWTKYNKHSEESLRRMSEANKGRRRSPKTEFKKGLVPWIKGKHHTQETLAKHSEFMKKLWTNPEFRQNQINKHKGRMPSNLGIDIGVRGKTTWMKGRHHTEEAKRKIGKAGKGRIISEETRAKLRGRSSTMKGKHHTQEAKEKNRLAHLGKTTWNKGIPWSEETRHKVQMNWRNEEYTKMMGRSTVRKPSKPEKHLIEFLNIHFPNEWKYVGDFKFWIEGRNPDFININGKKAIIEYNGYWKHTKEKDEAKTQHYALYGFKTLNLYPQDLKNESHLVQTISNFINP